MSLLFIFNSILLGVGLAMDAFSVSLANGLGEPEMKQKRMCVIAGTYAVFQAVMPLIGWFCVHTMVERFRAFEKFIPWIALALLSYIGGKMLIEGIRGGDDGDDARSSRLSLRELMVQGVATSIDALSVGFTISEYNEGLAFAAAAIIAAVTFVICIGGLAIGKKAGTYLAGKASVLGGIILIGIGLEIFVTAL